MVYQGNGGGWSPTLPALYRLKPKKNTDVIVMRSMAAITSQLLEPVSVNQLIINLEPRFKKRDDVILSNCKHAVLLHLQSVSKSTAKQHQRLYATKTIDSVFDLNAEVGEIETTAFFIKSTGRKNTAGKGIDALYAMNSRGRKTELVNGVTAMKVVCYELDDQGVLQLKKPTQVLNWLKVRSVKVYLLLRSKDNVLNKPIKYYFYGQQHLASDRRMYKKIQMVIPLRERG